MQRLFLIIKQRLIGFIFLLIALSGGIFLYFYINDFLTAAGLGSNFKTVFIASEDIPKDEIISDVSFAEKKIPLSTWNENYFTGTDDFIGSPAIYNINKEDILSSENVRGNLNKAHNFKGFSNYIPKNLRAVSIPVVFYGEISLLKVGDKVDILSIYPDQIKADFCAETIIEKKEIIIINSNNVNPEDYNSDGSRDGYMYKSFPDGGFMDYETGEINYGMKTIILTFFLNPDEAECVFLALEKGFLNISICPGEK